MSGRILLFGVYMNDNLGKNVFYLHTALHNGKDIPANNVLTSAINNTESVVVAGRHHDGTFYFASSVADKDKIMGLLENGKLFAHEIMKQMDE